MKSRSAIPYLGKLIIENKASYNGYDIIEY